MNKKIDLTEYGIEKQSDSVLTEEGDSYVIGRIISQEKGMYRVISARGEILAEISGKFRFHAKASIDYPAVGDFVAMDGTSYIDKALIDKILPRKSVFTRKAAGKNFEEQVVAANIDIIFICMSLNRDFNLRRLERYLTLSWDSGAKPVILLTKADLCSACEDFLLEVQQIAMGVDIIIASSINHTGYEQVLSLIEKGKTAAFIGSSGVGKSTLINQLLGEERLNTNGLRDDDKGRHTTTRRELFLLPQGGMVIDTPGMRELGLWNAGEGTERTFSDIEELAEKCRFADCTHTSEPGCAILTAIANGELSKERFLSYEKLKSENEYVEGKKDYLVKKREKFKHIAQINKRANRK